MEAYDLEPASAARLANISARGRVSAEEAHLIAGLILGNSISNTRVLVRVLGPSLAAAGIQTVLSDPMLEVRDSNGTLLAANDNWKETQQAEITGSGLAPTMLRNRPSRLRCRRAVRLPSAAETPAKWV